MSTKDARLDSRLQPKPRLTDEDGRARFQRRELVVLSIAVFVAFALRVYRLHDANVWWDEGFSVYLARKGLLDAAIATASDVHPPLHYWFLHVWTRLVGESEFAVRFSSVWFAVASVPLMYWLGRRIFGREVGLVAAVLLATSRFHIEWSQQIRMYTLVTAMTLLAIALTLRLWEDPRKRHWIGYAALTTTSMYTLYLSGIVAIVGSLITVILGLVSIGGSRLGRSFLVRWLGAHLTVLICFAPWAVLFLSSPHPIEQFVAPMDLRVFLHAVATTYPLGISAYVERYTPWAVATLTILALSLAVIAPRRHRRAGMLLLGLCIVPPLVLYSLSFPNAVFYKPTLFVRYLLIFLPAYQILVAASFVVLVQLALGRTRLIPVRATTAPARFVDWRVPRALRAMPVLLATATLASATIVGLTDYYPTRQRHDDYQTIVSYLEAYARPGDAVILNSDRDWPIFTYHAGDTLPRYGVGTQDPITAEGTEKLLAPLLARHGSLWLLTLDNGYDSDPGGHVRTWLDTHARLVGAITVANRQLALYSTDSARTVDVPNVVQPGRTTNIRLGDTLTILGYDLPITEIRTGEALHLAVYWQANASLPADRPIGLSLRDHNGMVYRDVRVAVQTSGTPEHLQPGKVFRADYALWIPPAMPPGSYELAVSLDGSGDDRPTANVDSNAVSNFKSNGVTSLARVQIVGDPASVPAVSPQHRVTFSLDGRIRLLGYDLDAQGATGSTSSTPPRIALSPGTNVRVRLYWQAIHAMPRAYTVFIQLVGSQTNPTTGNPVWAQRDGYPQGGKHPTTNWVPGEIVVDDYDLLVPPDAPSGEYFIHVGFYELETGRRLTVSQGDQASGDSIKLLEGQLRR